MRDELRSDFEDLFQNHPVPMVIFGTDLGLEKLNLAAQNICSAKGRIELGTTPAEFLNDLAKCLDGELAAHKLDRFPANACSSEAEPKPEQWGELPCVCLDGNRYLKPALYTLSSGRLHLTLTEEVGEVASSMVVPTIGQAHAKPLDELKADHSIDSNAAQHRANAILGDVVEALEEGFALWDSEMRFVMCNQKYHEMVFAPFGNQPPAFGEPAKQAIAREFEQGIFDHPEEWSKEEFVKEVVDWVASYGDHREFSYSNGRTLIVNCNRTELGGYLVTAIDLTDQRKVERLFAEIIGLMPVGIIVEDAKGELTHCNEAWRRFFGLSEDDANSMNREERIRANYRSVVEVNGVSCVGVPFEAHAEMLAAFYENGTPYELKLKDGRYLFVEIVRTLSGDAIVVLTDTTAAKSTQEDRLASINDVFDGIGEALVLYDKDGRYVLSNQSYRELYGMTRNPPKAGETFESVLRGLIDNGFYDLPPGTSKEAFFSAGVEAFYNRSAKGDFPINAADGRILLASSHQTRLDGYLISIRDVTEEHNSEERARELLFDAMESLEEGFSLWDKDLNFQMCNQKYLDLVMPFLEEPFPVGTPAEEVNRRVFQSGYVQLPEGIGEDDFIADFIDWSKTSGVARELLSTDGHAAVMRVQPTQLGGFLVTALDITRERQAEAELEQQRQISHQNEKLSALGELLAGVAHELNNPLSVVVGYSQMLQGQLPSDSQNEKIDRINQAAERSARIVKTFLAMARQKPSELEVCQLSEVVEVAVDVAGYGLRSSGTEVALDCDAPLPPVAIDRDQLAQVFSNLIVNAEQATARLNRPAEVRISLSYDTKRDEVVARVSDNGSGIAKETVSRIFDPFFTTKDVGEGTGFGLAFCHRIVTNHRGTLTVSSQEGVGSTFTIRLPASSAPQWQHGTQSVQAQTGANHHVLILDDEPLVAELNAEILAERGYHTQCVNSPLEALELAQRKAFDAILSDMKMPEMTGEQFYRALLAQKPEYEGRIGFVTGDALSEGINRFLGSTKVQFIKKPIMADELEALAARLCDSGKAPA